MPDEQIDEQLKKAEPEGPFKYGRYFSPKNMGIGAVLIVGGYLMFKQTPQGPKPMGPAAPKQTIVDATPIEKPTVPMQNTSYNPNAAAEAPVQRQLAGEAYQPAVPSKPDPVEQLREQRRQMEMKAALAQNIVIEEPQAAKSEAEAPVAGTSSQDGLKVKPSQAAYTLPEGTVIEAVLDSKLEGEMTGPVDAHVSTDVYVPGTRDLVIPQGAKALGEATKVGAFGQQRLAVTFHKLQVFQEGKPFCSIALEKDPGLDQQGGVGLTGKVNNHTMSLLAAASVVGLIQGASIGFSYGGGGGYDPSSVMIGNLASGAAQTTSRILDRYTNRVPTITVPEGTRIKLRLIRDTPSSCEVSQ
jgi:type IV secretory pathway VirB10-like protein